MTQAIQFCKMHGLGNDFVVIDAINQLIHLDQSMIQSMADRCLGIGFDQLLLIKRSERADFACRIFNKDGSEAEQCGNGMRCVARFLQEESLTNKKKLTIETKAGLMPISIPNYERIQVAMGVPSFSPAAIPFLAEKENTLYDLTIAGFDNPLQMAVISMGNPHAILFVKSIANCPFFEIGPLLAKHAAFPQGVNVGFVEIVNRTHIRLRTYERGAGETRACGSNACAAVVAGVINDSLDRSVMVELQYGNLYIDWESRESSVNMAGPASRVFSGNIIL